VLGIDKSDNTYGYYYVDHGSKSLFWAEDHKLHLPEIFANVPVTEKSHISVSARYHVCFASFNEIFIEYAYEYEYWFAAYC
jgi:hypothetical protein